MKRLSFIICLLVITGCKKEVKKPVQEECNAVYEVALDLDHYAKDSLGNYIDMPRFDYYEEHNFIIDKSDRIFYYPQKKVYAWNCVVPDKKTPIPPPDFINLQPFQIIQLSKKQIGDFVRLNINKKDETSFIVIASERNKFKSETLCELYNSFYINTSSNLSILRRMTEEEKVVMSYYKSDSVYNPYQIKWDETKIKFMKLEPIEVQKK